MTRQALGSESPSLVQPATRLAACAMIGYIGALLMSSSMAATPCQPGVVPGWQSLTPMEEQGLWGYVDERGNRVISPRFQFADSFTDAGLAAVYLPDSGWAYINAEGEVVVTPVARDNGPDPFAEGLARYHDSGKYGFFGENGCHVVDALFDGAMPFAQGRAAVCLGCVLDGGEHQAFSGGHWGYVDQYGDVVIPLIYDAASSFNSGLAEVVLDGRTKRIDRSGDYLP